MILESTDVLNVIHNWGFLGTPHYNSFDTNKTCIVHNQNLFHYVIVFHILDTSHSMAFAPTSECELLVNSPLDLLLDMASVVDHIAFATLVALRCSHMFVEELVVEEGSIACYS